MIKYTGKLLGIIKDISNGGVIAQFHLNGSGNELGEMAEKELDLRITEHRGKRSLDANAYAWVLMDKLSEKTGVDKETIYRETIKNIGGNTDTVCLREDAAERFVSMWREKGLGWFCETFTSRLRGCTNVIVYYGSSTYDTRQMSRLIDLLVQECKEQSIETLPPERLAAMKEGWR